MSTLLSHVAQIGDKVVINIYPELRSYCNEYDNVPDGTTGIVCGIRDVVIYQA